MSGISAIGAGGVSSVWQWASNHYQNLAAARKAALSPAQPNAPVEPVRPVKPVVGAAQTAAVLPVTLPETRLPSVEDLNNAADNLARMRIEYLDQAAGAQTLSPWGGTLSAGLGPSAGYDLGGGADGTTASVDGLEEGGLAGRVDPADCETCKRRQYQDGSDDPGVSFKTPTHISPEQAGAAVRGHEQEHVVREQAKAKREGRKVVSQSVSIHTAVCPECGRVYVSGGVTKTVTAKDDSDKNKLWDGELFPTQLRIEIDPKEEGEE